MEFPGEFLRGIPNNTFVSNDGLPTGSLFTFQNKNSSGYFEESITWNDEYEAINTLLNQKKGDEFQFKVGLAICCRFELEKTIAKAKTFNCRMAYERDPLDNNIYHGNILLEDNPRKKMIVAHLVVNCFKNMINR